jgi:hypothetical protein
MHHYNFISLIQSSQKCISWMLTNLILISLLTPLIQISYAQELTEITPENSQITEETFAELIDENAITHENNEVHEEISNEGNEADSVMTEVEIQSGSVSEGDETEADSVITPDVSPETSVETETADESNESDPVIVDETNETNQIHEPVTLTPEQLNASIIDAEFSPEPVQVIADNVVQIKLSNYQIP